MMTRFVKLLSVAAVASLAVACASAPKPAEQANAQAIPSATAKDAELTGEKIVALQHAGYKIVNKNGEKLYCSTDAKTGSRLQKDNTCLTEKELLALREETKRNMQNVTMQLTPPQGK